MKSRKFPTFTDAVACMEERGELKYWGREGTDAKTYVYSLTIGSIVYEIFLDEDGYLRVTDQRCKE